MQRANLSRTAISLLLLGIIWMPACGIIYATPTTTSLLPTNTFTPLPSSTSTPTHTPTPTVTSIPTQIPNTSLSIRGWIDGDSQLIIYRDTLRWYHQGAAAPGRLNGSLEPTYINDIPWYPEWPDIPTAENRDCFCKSSKFSGILPLSPVPQTVKLELIIVRGETRILAQPNRTNDFTLIIGLDDGPPPAADWYEIRIYYYSAP